jgi:aminotransferase
MAIIASACAGIVKAILQDENRIIPVSTLLEGEYGEEDVFAGVPVVLNRTGASDIGVLRLTPEELEAAITPRSKILVLPFPNNPTGGIMEKEDLEAIREIIIKNDLYVLSDEIYGELTYTGKPHVSIASLPGMKERTVVVNGFSKAYAMTGWRLGFACGPQEIISQMVKIHQYAIMCAPTTSQYAAVEALRNGDEDVRMMRESYNERRRFVLHMLNEMGIPCFEPMGAFYVFPCIKEFGLSSEEFANRLLAEEKVAIVPGTAFGDSGEGFLRISYAYSIDNLRKALDRLSHFVAKLREEK